MTWFAMQGVYTGGVVSPSSTDMQGSWATHSGIGRWLRWRSVVDSVTSDDHTGSRKGFVSKCVILEGHDLR